MKRRDLLIAKLKARQKIGSAVMAHAKNFAPQQQAPQEMMNNAPTDPSQQQQAAPAPQAPPTDQPV